MNSLFTELPGRPAPALAFFAWQVFFCCSYAHFHASQFIEQGNIVATEFAQWCVAQIGEPGPRTPANFSHNLCEFFRAGRCFKKTSCARSWIRDCSRSPENSFFPILQPMVGELVYLVIGATGLHRLGGIATPCGLSTHGTIVSPNISREKMTLNGRVQQHCFPPASSPSRRSRPKSTRSIVAATYFIRWAASISS